MRKLTKNEIKAATLIFLVTFVVTFYNLRIALRRSRDVQRRSDVAAVTEALGAFHRDYGFYPASDGGKIKLCKGPNFDEVAADAFDDEVYDRNKLMQELVGCEWGRSNLENVFAEGVYIAVPSDPRAKTGSQYLYLSDTQYFQIFTSLEGGAAEDTYNKSVAGRLLPCGNKVCSFGKSSFDIPLHISIEEYRKIEEQKKPGN